MNYDSINKAVVDKFIAHYANTDQLGLSSGRAGIALLCFLMACREENNDYYWGLGEKHLLYLSQHVYEVQNISFTNGLLGIGWLLEFITQARGTEYDYTDILEEIDNVIYKQVTFHRNLPFSLDNGYIGCYFYLYYRLKGTRKGMSFYEELALKECIVLVMGRLYQEMQKGEEGALTIYDWLQCHILTGQFRLLQIQDTITRNILIETRKKLSTNGKVVHRKIHLEESCTLLDALHYLVMQTDGYRVLSNFL